MFRKILYVTFAIVLIASMVGCGAKPATSGGTTGGKIKVGLSFSDYATERWPIEAAQMTQLLQKTGLRSDRTGSRP